MSLPAEFIKMKNLNFFDYASLLISKTSSQSHYKAKHILPAIALLVAAIISRLPYEFHRLLFSNTELGAIDLIQRYDEVLLWFSGQHIYSILNSAVYPPASYLMMWPFMGFYSWQLVRWIWAISTVIFLVVLTKILLKNHSLETPLQKTFWALFILAHYSTGITIGNGQFTIYIMLALVACMIFILPGKNHWLKSILGGFFAALSLIKPTVALPFMWLVLFVPKNMYPALATIVIYAGFSLVACSFQEQEIFQLHFDWLSLGMKGAAWSSLISESGEESAFLGKDIGYADIHNLLASLGMSHWALPVSLSLLALLGCWVYFHRNCNLWILMGVTTIFSRIWTYHRVYDDMLIILAIFAVIFILKENLNSETEKVGKALLIIAIVCSLAPASLRLLPSPWDLAFKLSQLSVWLAMLIYLLDSAYKEKKSNKLSNLLNE